MGKFFKFNLFLMVFFVFILSFSGCSFTSKPSANYSNGFGEPEAIAESVKNHPEFPIKPNDTIIKELPTGGPSGSTAKVKFTTHVESSEKNTYLITLTKDWGITVNGTYVKSFWEYKVTKNSIKLIKSVDNDYLPATMK